MAGSGTELEVKFYVTDLGGLEERARALGARLVQARVHEVNLRFDTPDRQLSGTLQALRLRKDNEARVTYKGPSQEQDGARLRKELEFTVSDFDAARELFEALGYQLVVMYEKYRAVYALDRVLLTLDEMPYGQFAEIEGPDGAAIQNAAARLGLDWECRILDSYLTIFERLKKELGLAFQHLSFENFQGLHMPVESLKVKAADAQ